jgi:hypothetical protein
VNLAPVRAFDFHHCLLGGLKALQIGLDASGGS